ncbi:MAG: hypothetical protein M1830_001541 [Pleopsidium flavum]|nr:MAG: hypothetical protein M1830_001541 [Pleopsidium flavum]
MENLGVQESLGSSTRLSNHNVQYGQSNDRDISASPEHRSHDWTSQSLPDDLSISTEIFASKGGFINVRRGGYSNDGSFQRRILSPSSLPDVDESGVLPERRLDGDNDRSVQVTALISAPALAILHRAVPSAPTTSRVLKTPGTSPTRGDADSAKQESSGSPLKLFGDYDTFTNDRLLRRMSQFQVSFPEDFNPEENDQALGLGRTHAADSPPCLSAGSEFVIENVNHSALATSLPKQSTRINSFGEGHLHGYEFKEEVSITSSRSMSSYDDSETQLKLCEFDHGAETRVAIHLERSPEIRGSGQFPRKLDRSSTRKLSTITRRWVAEANGADRKNCTKHKSQRQETSGELQEVEEHLRGKRPPNSPAKDPAPKRRRTSDIVGSEFYREDVDATAQNSQQMRSVIGRKRKDARYDSIDAEADPKIIALRQMLRPRTPTPKPNRRPGRQPEAIEGISSGTPKPRKQATLGRQVADVIEAAEGVEAQTQAVAAELATFAVQAAENITTDSRKPSITTQDFINEATKVMNIIRAKGKPPSGLVSIESSEAEETENNEPAYDDQSTKDEFSRPPSREGVSLRRVRAPKQLDPRVISHLRKFEEKDDVDVILASSLKCLDIDRHGSNTRNTAESKHVFISERKVESQPSNIQIFENVQAHRKRKHSSPSVQEDMVGQSHDEVHSHASQPSSGPSTGRSIPTGSSRSSGNKALIAPEKVSHLIPAQAAGMTYDHTQQTWVKRKGSEVPSAAGPAKTTSETTEDDPFEDIPDLSVDELEEMKRIRTLAIQIKEGLVKPIETSGTSRRGSTSKQEQPSGGSMGDSRPRTREGVEEAPFDTSSVPSRYSYRASSQPMTETRATSLGDEDYATKVHPERNQDLAEALQPSPRDHEEDVEHEISILEGRLSKTPIKPDHLKYKARVVTVAFSSPLVNHVQTHEYEESPDRDPRLWTESCESILEDSGLGHFSGPVRSQRNASKRTPASFAQRSTNCSIARRVSFGGQSFTARPISRIDELNEVSFSECHGETPRQSLDVAVSTPLAAPSSTGRCSNFGFHLSPLPDFTVHQLDESFQLDIRHVAKRNTHLSAKDVEGSFSLAIQELVKKITDVEPYEPYWDYIRQLDLRGQGLITLYMLREFCGRIEELDVADNQLGQLNGAPAAIRHLRIQRNCLSSLTAWGHMCNLQYLDVSGNQIESLDGFSSLIHLRELRADDNRIHDIEGILDLDGLITLRLRGNCLETVDFEGAELKHLYELDLSGNQLKDVLNLHSLPALVHLDLDHNELVNFPATASQPLRSLQSLELASNHLKTLDVSLFSQLRILRLDKNSIFQVDNLHKAEHLEILSMREQVLALEPNTAHVRIDDGLDIRHLYLSGNTVPILSPRAEFLNLQHLELASSGLQSLPPNFGLRIANTRSLNLNFNALKDIRPLLGIIRLTKLSLVGNRLCRLRRTTAVLAKFTTLHDLDLRNNPMTLGFHPPVSTSTETRLVAHTSSRNENTDTEDTSGSPYDLAPGTKTIDAPYRERLDADTKLRRRVYEMLLAGGCRCLSKLDGLDFEREEVERKDWVWKRLVEIGVVVLKEKGAEKEKKKDEGDEEVRELDDVEVGEKKKEEEGDEGDTGVETRSKD